MGCLSLAILVGLCVAEVGSSILNDGCIDKPTKILSSPSGKYIARVRYSGCFIRAEFSLELSDLKGLSTNYLDATTVGNIVWKDETTLWVNYNKDSQYRSATHIWSGANIVFLDSDSSQLRKFPQSLLTESAYHFTCDVHFSIRNVNGSENLSRSTSGLC